MRLKILLTILALLILGSGSYLVANTYFKPKPPKETKLVGFENLKDEATKSAETKKEESKAQSGEVSGAITPIIGQQTVQQTTPQESTPYETGKIEALKNLFEKMTKSATIIYLNNQEAKKLTNQLMKLVNEGFPECKKPEIRNPFERLRLEADCSGAIYKNYQNLIEFHYSTITSSTSDYQKWESQAQNIIASCSLVCKDMWNAYVKGLTSQGVPLP